MNDILCVYFSRTGHDSRIAMRLERNVSADLAEIDDGKNWDGILGYIRGAVFALKKVLPEVEINLTRDISEYDKVIVAAPIWCEDVCPQAKAFLKKYGKEIKGDVYFVISHMSNLGYEDKIYMLNDFLDRPYVSHLTVQTGKGNDYISGVDEFAEEIK